MRAIISVTIAAIIGIAVLYGAVAFITLEINPLKWEENTRVVVVLFGWVTPVIFSALTLFVIEFKKIEDEK